MWYLYICIPEILTGMMSPLKGSDNRARVPWLTSTVRWGNGREVGRLFIKVLDWGDSLHSSSQRFQALAVAYIVGTPTIQAIGGSTNEIWRDQWDRGSRIYREHPSKDSVMGEHGSAEDVVSNGLDAMTPHSGFRGLQRHHIQWLH